MNEEFGIRNEELKPVRCGCGGLAEVDCYLGDNNNHDLYYVYCQKCYIQSANYKTEAKAITAWNRAMSGEPERKKGEWQRRKGSDCWECSQCHAVLENDDLGMHNFYFCYHCGANMMNKSGYMDIEEVHYE